jgi:hypothetical protein
MAELTINEALVWMKTLRERHGELVGLRNENSASHTRRYGMGGDKEVTTAPTYDVKVLDKMVAGVAKEIRTLDMAIKSTNGVTKVVGYSQDDSVLGELA